MLWSMRVWRILPARHTSRVVSLVGDDGWASRGPLASADGTIGRRTLLRLLEQRNAEMLRRVA